RLDAPSGRNETQTAIRGRLTLRLPPRPASSNGIGRGANAERSVSFNPIRSHRAPERTQVPGPKGHVHGCTFSRALGSRGAQGTRPRFATVFERLGGLSLGHVSFAAKER